MNPQAWITLAAVVVSAFSLLVSLKMARDKAEESAVDKLEKRIEALESMLERCEQSRRDLQSENRELLIRIAQKV